ncbi:MAG: Mrp/NBP35 family ATP-binding protein [Bacteroidales bacterium]|nr:Mrp/NBP35 family ATP-binding protein [Bacteroidales bacterium]
MTKIIELLSAVEHPAMEGDIVSLGIAADLKIADAQGGELDPEAEGVDEKIASIKFKLVFPSPDPFSADLKKECEEILEREFPGASVTIIEMVAPRRETKRTVDELNDQELKKIGKIIAVASGKGGVGKSTVTVNLAAALCRKGYKVGIVDADIYGPSIPKMTGTEGISPLVEQATNLIVPIEKWGMKILSIGHLVEPEQALIWRGPMACNALKQLIMQVKWGELDYLLIDLPPGTGDIHISLVHDIPLAGAVIVTTPGQVAIADVIKNVNMFKHKDINIPIYGLIENMAWFTPAELPHNRYYIFGKDGGRKMAQETGIPFLGSIPIYMSVSEGGDTGMPAAMGDNPVATAFASISTSLEK